MDSTSETNALVGQAELEKLSSELATRESITHFAVAGVSTMVGLISLGLSLRLALDVGEPLVVAPVGAVFVGCVGVALFGILKGRRLRSAERSTFEHYLAMRTAAGLD